MVLENLPDHFLLMNGDILTDMNYADLLKFHIESDAPLTVATNERVTRSTSASSISKTGDHVFTKKPPLTYNVSMGATP